MAESGCQVSGAAPRPGLEKRLSVVGRRGQIGRGGSRGAEVGSLAAWAGLGRKERAAGLSALETGGDKASMGLGK